MLSQSLKGRRLLECELIVRSRGTVFASMVYVATLDATPLTVKYRGAVDLKPFVCTDTPRSSFIQSVCVGFAR